VKAQRVDAGIAVVIVGAGIAGLAAAQTLQAAGKSCVVLEKSRAPFGRIATRTFGERSFNYGALDVELTTDGFADELEAFGVDVVALTAALQVGGSGLRSVLAPLAAGLDLRVNHQVRLVQRSAGVAFGFDVVTTCGICLHAAHVVLALPAPQVGALIASCADFAELRAQCAQLEYAPSCVVTVLAPHDLAVRASAGWQERKPAALALTSDGARRWVLRQWECVGDDALRLRPGNELAVLADLGFTGADIDGLQEIHVKHWRYARRDGKNSSNSAFFAEHGVYVVGDFQRGSVASAYQSGQLAARNLLCG
jgi:renalase